jgi:hypothetical protein
MSLLLAPNHDLVSWRRIITREEPEEELPCLIFLLRNGEQTRVALANIPGNVGESAAVDCKGCGRCQLGNTDIPSAKRTRGG